MKSINYFQNKILFLWIFLFVTACARPPAPASISNKDGSDTMLSTVTAEPNGQITTTVQPIENSDFYWLKTTNGDEKIYLNPWTNISSKKIQPYTFTYPISSATGKDGSTWYIGPFGVIWQKPDASHVLFSNEHPNPYGFPNGGNFRLITIGPDGQVWVGGRDKNLFRFDGKKWVNEGENIPDMPGNPNWLCYSKHIVGIDFGQDGSPWILTAEIEIYHQVNEKWINFPNPLPDKFMPIAGGGACPGGIKVYSPTDIVIERGGCCARPSIGIHFNGKTWEETNDFKDVEMMFQWVDNFYLVKSVDDKLTVILAIHEKDKTISVVPFFSWLAPPVGTYVVENEDSLIYITNQNISQEQAIIAKFDKKTQIWKGFLFNDFDNDELCAAHIDKDGYIWLQFNCFNRDTNGVLLPVQDNLYRLSPDIFDDYKAPHNMP